MTDKFCRYCLYNDLGICRNDTSPHHGKNVNGYEPCEHWVEDEIVRMEWSESVPILSDSLESAHTRADILESAKTCITGQREQDYGSPEDNFAAIAAFWNVYLSKRKAPNADITPHDVSVMMCLLKIARTLTGNVHTDNYVDLAGYAACAGEIAAKTNDRKENQP